MKKIFILILLPFFVQAYGLDSLDLIVEPSEFEQLDFSDHLVVEERKRIVIEEEIDFTKDHMSSSFFGFDSSE